MLEIKIKYELVKVLSVHQIVVKHFLDHEHHLVSFVATKNLQRFGDDYSRDYSWNIVAKRFYNK